MKEIWIENNLEQLLNSLIERGRCPFWKKDVYIETGEWYDFEAWWIILKKEKGWTYTCESKYMPYRMLCTKSSWLWQFVCENGMVNKNKQYSFIKWSWKGRTDERNQQSYIYRLIESSLKDENELEEFLLQNIKLD